MSELEGLSVLLLEDEFLIALDAEEILKELGVANVAVASNILDARKLAEEGRWDVAILDVNINGELSFPLADVFRAKGVPVLFATGYELQSRPNLPVECRVTVSKPYTSATLGAAVLAALRDAEPSGRARPSCEERVAQK